MKTKLYPLIGGIFLIALSFLIGRWTSSSSTPTPHAGHEHANVATASYTCSMHPQVRQNEPGKCPICAMDLVPIDSVDSDGPRALSMSESSRALAEIQTSVVERRFPQAEIRLFGKLDYDETKVRSLTARFPARIDELFVNFNGVAVKQGDHLARVYSPELLTAQSELLTAFRYDPQGATTDSIKEKLRLWDLLPEQIESIIEEGKASDHFELKAPVTGVVVRKNVNEGDYLTTGQPLFTIVDLDVLWLRLEAFESDLAWLRFGQTIEFEVEAYPGQTFQGLIAFIEPELDRATRTVSIRVNVPNADGKLKPGMFAKAIARSQVAQAGNVFAPEYAGKWISPMHPEIVKDGPGSCDICGMDLLPAEELGYIQDPEAAAPLIVPAAAVLRTGKRAVVYVEKPDSLRPTYEGREIVIGPRAGDVYIVVAGLEVGDRVVTQGAFKIDSALQIQAKPSMMSEEGQAPASHHHSHEPHASSVSHHSHEVGIALDIATAKALLPFYFAMQTGLANDDLNSTKAALMDMMGVVGHEGPLSGLIHGMLGSSDLDGIRRPHFETLSAAFIEAVSENADQMDTEIFQMHCPMVYPDRGASWLQSNSELLNPYFGAAMLHCGTQEKKY